jgi:hypothetical protein
MKRHAPVPLVCPRATDHRSSWTQPSPRFLSSLRRHVDVRHRQHGRPRVRQRAGQPCHSAAAPMPAPPVGSSCFSRVRMRRDSNRTQRGCHNDKKDNKKDAKAKPDGKPDDKPADAELSPGDAPGASASMMRSPDFLSNQTLTVLPIAGGIRETKGMSAFNGVARRKLFGGSRWLGFQMGSPRALKRAGLVLLVMLVPRPRRLFETQPVCRYQHLSRVP